MKCSKQDFLRNSQEESHKIFFNMAPYNDEYIFMEDFSFDDIQPGDYVKIYHDLDTCDLYANNDTLLEIGPEHICHSGRTAKVLNKFLGSVIIEWISGTEEVWPHGCFSALYKFKKPVQEIKGEIILKRKGKKKRRLTASGRSEITIGTIH